MRKVKYGIIYISIFVVLILASGTVSAADITVNPGGSIQTAINQASNNDVVILNDNNGAAHTYTENVVIDKDLTLKSDGSVTVQALNASKPVFTVNSGGSGSTISGLTISGATRSSGIRLNSASNCFIDSNEISDNKFGVYVCSSCENTITGNSVSNNLNNGFKFISSSDNNLISRNTVSNNDSGFYFEGSDGNHVMENIITGNTSYGLYLFESVGTEVHFNQIFANQYGILSDLGSYTTYAQNNWWGVNNPSNPGDIRMDDGTVIYNPWMILNISADPASLNRGESVVTADLTHNNQGSDTSSSGCVPDGMPVNFTTNLGTVTSPAYTRNGKANATFDSGSSSGVAHLQGKVDGQSVQTDITVVANNDTPTVTNMYPQNGRLIGSADVEYESVSIIFSEPIQAGISYNNINIAVQDYDGYNSRNININKSISGSSLTLTPDSFWASGDYTVTVPVNSIKNMAGNGLATAFTLSFRADTTPPTVTATPTGGNYTGGQVVTLTATDNLDSNPYIRYSTNGGFPNTTYTGPINITNTTTLKFKTGDDVGNFGPLQTVIYTIGTADTTPPTVTASPTGGVYTASQSVTLTAVDDVDPNPAIYYTTNGNTPNSFSTPYTTPINISNTTTLKFIAIDALNNSSSVQTATYTIGAIDTTPPMVSASPAGGTYSSAQTVTLTATDNLDPNPAIYYTLNGTAPTTSSSQYKGPISVGTSVSLSFMAVDASGNVSVVQSQYYTIYANNSGVATLTVTSNALDASTGHEVVVGYNTTTESKVFNWYRLAKLLAGPEGNVNALRLYVANFFEDMRIMDCGPLPEDVLKGLIRQHLYDFPSNDGWWGDETILQFVYEWGLPSDYVQYIEQGGMFNQTVVNTLYGLMWDDVGSCTVQTPPINDRDNDIWYNKIWNVGNNLEIPFSQNFNYLPTSWVRSTTTTVPITEMQYSPLSVSYQVPLYDPTTWVSVVWKAPGSNTGSVYDVPSFEEEVDVIVNGNVVISKTVINEAYKNFCNSYRPEVFNMILAANHCLPPTVPNDDPVAIAIWNMYSGVLTAQELEFIKNYRLMFMNELSIILSYPGESAKTISVSSSGSGGQNVNLNFPGNPVQRTSLISYLNGVYEGQSAGYDGVRSFAITNTKVTDSMLQSWLNQKSWYAIGPMKAAYGTFLTSLILIKCHDMVADQAANDLGVFWSRSSPVVVSAGDEEFSTYITLECDHKMGMSVSGDSGNVKAFRFACSSAISPLEGYAMKTLFPNSEGYSVTVDLGKMLLDGSPLDIYMSNGYLVMKPLNGADEYILIDPSTGVVRDILFGTYCGSYCFSNQQTEWASDLGNRLVNNPPVWVGLIGSVCVGSVTSTSAGVSVGVSVGTLGSVITGCGAIGGIAVSAAIIAYEPYFWLYEFPGKLEMLKKMHDITVNQEPLFLGTISLFLPDDQEPTSQEIEEAYRKAGQLIMSIAENNNTELYNNLIDIGNLYLKGKKPNKIKVGNQIGILQDDGITYKWFDGGPDLDPEQLKEAILSICRFIKDQGVNLHNAAMAGNPLAVAAAAGRIGLATSSLLLLLEATFQLTEYYDQFEDLWENRTGNNSTPGGSGGGG